MDAAGNYIAGEWIASSEAAEDINPSNTGDIVGLFARADATATERAIAAAKAAFPAWSRGVDPAASRHPEARSATRSSRARTSSAACSRARKARHSPKASARPYAPARSSCSSPANACGWAARRSRRCARASTSRSRASRSASSGIITPWNFPIAIPGVEDRAGARVRQLRRVQAGRPRAGNRACAVEDHRRVGHSAGRVQPRHGTRLGRRRDADRAPRHRGDLVHRIGGHRPEHRRRVRRPA